MRGFGVSGAGALAGKGMREDAGPLAGPGARAVGGRLGFRVRLLGAGATGLAPGVLFL